MIKAWKLLALVAVTGLMADRCPTPQTESTSQNANQAGNTPPVVVLEQQKHPACTLTPRNALHFQVTGQGVAPVNTVSPAQAMALAKRAAIADAYRQLGEKICGVQVEGRDLIRNMMISRSTVRTHINAMIRNARIIDTKFKDGLCEVEMEVTVRGNEWYPRLVR